MTVRRALAALGTAPALALAMVPITAGPASAHGALGSPASRAARCGPEGGAAARSAACRAAVAASSPGVLAQWDNLRVPGVAGRDRQLIPDGRLCSGGLDRYRGLDLARPDWPATGLTGGRAFTFRYRVTIPHRGIFKLYVTRDDYDPRRRLTWSALERRPFLQLTDPARRDGAYVLRGRLPAGKTGRHVIYTIWQTTDTPDTYYSCSDVIFRAKRTAKPRPTGTPEAAAPSAGPARPSASAEPAPALDPAAAASTASAGQDGWGPVPWVIGGVIGVMLAATGLIVRLRRRPDGI